MIILNFTPFEFNTFSCFAHEEQNSRKFNLNVFVVILLPQWETFDLLYYSVLCKNNRIIQFIKTFKKFSAKNFCKKHKKFSVEWCVLKFCSLAVFISSVVVFAFPFVSLLVDFETKFWFGLNTKPSFNFGCSYFMAKNLPLRQVKRRWQLRFSCFGNKFAFAELKQKWMF